MIDLKRTIRTKQLRNKVFQGRNIALEKWTIFPQINTYIRYEDSGDMNRALYHYERGVAQGDSASLYVSLYKIPN